MEPTGGQRRRCVRWWGEPRVVPVEDEEDSSEPEWEILESSTGSGRDMSSDGKRTMLGS